MSALSEAIDDLAARTVTRVTITQYVDLLGGTGRGGGTARAAKELGISQREVQRYLAFERGDEKQRRKPPAVRLRGIAPDAVRRRLARDGARVEHIFYRDLYDDRERDVSRPVDIPAEAMRGALEAPGDTQDGAMGQAFISAYFGGTQDVTDVGQIVLSFAE